MTRAASIGNRLLTIVAGVFLAVMLAGCQNPQPANTVHYPVTVMLDPVTEGVPNVSTNR